MTGYYEALCGWEWLDGGGGWLPVRLPVGLPRPSREPAQCARPAEALATIGDAGGQAVIAVAQRPERIRAGAGSTLSARSSASARPGSGAPPAAPPAARPHGGCGRAGQAVHAHRVSGREGRWMAPDRHRRTDSRLPALRDIRPAELAAAMCRPSPGEVPRRSGHPVVVLLGSSASGFAACRLREGRL